jgi:hypothetical protein
MATRAELQRQLSDAFAGQGWPYEAIVRERVLGRIDQTGGASGDELASCVPTDYLSRHGITHGQMARVLDLAVGGEGLVPDVSNTGTTVINFEDHSHSIDIGDNANIANSTFNTGTHITAGPETSHEDVMGAIAVLVRAGLAGEWNAPAAADLAKVVEARSDVSFDDVHRTAVSATKDVDVEPGKAKALLAKISTGAASGLLSTGIAAALGLLL